MPTFSTLRIDTDPAHPRIARLLLNRPERLNALSTAMLDGLLEALPRLVADANIAVVVLTGAGRGFCAGGDVKSMADGSSQLGAQHSVHLLCLFWGSGFACSNGPYGFVGHHNFADTMAHSMNGRSQLALYHPLGLARFALRQRFAYAHNGCDAFR